jgi:hypothetical protein
MLLHVQTEPCWRDDSVPHECGIVDGITRSSFRASDEPLPSLPLFGMGDAISPTVTLRTAESDSQRPLPRFGKEVYASGATAASRWIVLLVTTKPGDGPAPGEVHAAQHDAAGWVHRWE